MLGCEQQFANSNFTSLELQRMVSAKLAQRRGAALFGPPTQVFSSIQTAPSFAFPQSAEPRRETRNATTKKVLCTHT